jgi:glycosyltransferase involved in cell wall biosynthesis
MKIHILYEIKEGPWGGGNQFLKALRDNWRRNNKYAETISDADVILINSHHISYYDLYTHNNSGKNKIIIHRIDGPISIARGSGEELDNLIYYFNYRVSDGTIFQSEWSKNENYKIGYIKNKFEIIIINAPNQNIFYNRNIQEKNEKIKIIATSWSDNLRKGFDIYQYLDKNLDFCKYEMTFAGNTPIKFTNIKHVPPLTSNQLADLLCNHDIYITASKIEACSNSLIEALHCGLPAVYIRQGSHGSIVGEAGEGFTGTTDILNAIDLVAKNLNKYKNKYFFKPMDEVAESYYCFCEMIFQEMQNGSYVPKKFTRMKFYEIRIRVYILNLKSKVHNFFSLILPKGN